MQDECLQALWIGKDIGKVRKQNPQVRFDGSVIQVSILGCILKTLWTGRSKLSWTTPELVQGMPRLFGSSWRIPFLKTVSTLMYIPNPNNVETC